MKTCGICSHPERAAIDADLVEQGSLRVVAGQFSVSRSALDRHRKHIPPALALAKQAVEVADATTLLSRVERLMSRTETICQKATEQGAWTGAVGASRELRCCIELLARLSGALSPAGVTVNTQINDSQSVETMTNEEIESQLWGLIGSGLKCEHCGGVLSKTGVFG